MKTVFLRVLEAEDKANALLDAIREAENAHGRHRFEVDPRFFSSVQRSPFSYWVSDGLRGVFRDFPRLEREGRTAQVGVATGDDERFVRAWWGVQQAIRTRWFPFAKGGAFSTFYADIHLLVDWLRDGAPIELSFVGGRVRKVLFFRPGVTWSRRSQRGLSLRPIPAGCIFSDKSPTACTEGDDSHALLALVAISNSLAFRAMVQMQMAFGSYEVGVLQRTPVPRLTEASRSDLARLARQAWSLKRSLDTRTETSHAFTLPALLQVADTALAARAAAWSEHVRTVEAELGGIQAEIDDRCFALYGIDEADRRAITEGFGTRGSEEASSDGANDAENDAGEETHENESTADATGLAAELVSWAVGVAFGRFDMRLATGARPLPTEPEPFDPLPTCSPGMLPEDLFLGARASCPPFAGETPALPGVLVDDLGHGQDLPTAVRAVFDAVFGAGADHWWNDVAALLDPKGHDLRVWLAGSFFEHHLERHSKSRRKAPILWQLDTPSGRYSVWLYAHRLTRDSFFQLQNEVVVPKLTHEERQLTSLMRNAGGSPSAPERKEIAAQEAVVEELRALLDEVKRVAPLWNPNLDDGVVLTMAPLWRLVPQHKPWKKELKSKWDELCAGKYDWAHMAMHLWPERVVPKCATDRSLAIAHGLEEVFWEQVSQARNQVSGVRGQGAGKKILKPDARDLIPAGDRVQGSGKWIPRPDTRHLIPDLVRERSSSAVRAALQSLLDAPVAAVGGGRGRRAAKCV